MSLANDLHFEQIRCAFQTKRYAAGDYHFGDNGYFGKFFSHEFSNTAYIFSFGR
jgi:hypothetical protein